MPAPAQPHRPWTHEPLQHCALVAHVASAATQVHTSPSCPATAPEIPEQHSDAFCAGAPRGEQAGDGGGEVQSSVARSLPVGVTSTTLQVGLCVLPAQLASRASKAATDRPGRKLMPPGLAHGPRSACRPNGGGASVEYPDGDPVRPDLRSRPVASRRRAGGEPRRSSRGPRRSGADRRPPRAPPGSARTRARRR